MSDPHDALPPPPAAPRGSAPGHYPPPVRRTSSVRQLGIATQVVLGLQLIATVVLLFPTLHERSLIGRLQQDPTSVSLTEAQNADDTVTAIGLVVTILYVASAVVWIIWFYRGRVNAGVWAPNLQRRSTGWAIGGWICPVVNLWFPYMMTRDIVGAAEHDVRDLPRSRPLLNFWWAGFLAVAVFVLIGRAQRNAESLAALHTHATSNVVSVVVRAVALVLAIAAVQQITATQESRRARDAAAALA